MYVFCLVRLDWSACDAFLKIDVLSITHKLGKNKETASKNSLNPLSFRRFRPFFTLHVLLFFLSEHIIPTPWTEPVVNAVFTEIVSFLLLNYNCTSKILQISQQNTKTVLRLTAILQYFVMYSCYETLANFIRLFFTPAILPVEPVCFSPFCS